VVLDATSVFERVTVLAGVLVAEDFVLTVPANQHTTNHNLASLLLSVHAINFLPKSLHIFYYT